MKTIILNPVWRSNQELAADEKAVTVRISGRDTTLFLVGKAAMAAGYQVSRATDNPHYASMMILRGKSLRETAMFMLEVAEIVRGTWWASGNLSGFMERKLNLDVIEKLERVLDQGYRFELRV